MQHYSTMKSQTAPSNCVVLQHPDLFLLQQGIIVVDVVSGRFDLPKGYKPGEHNHQA